MNRKQKAIDMIRRGLVSASRHEDANDYALKFGEPEAAFLYDDLLPLIRGEFPEEEINQELTSLWHSARNIHQPKEPEKIIDYYFCRIKRLYEGDHIAEIGKSVGLRPDAQHEMNKRASQGLANIEASEEKVCQGCGGSGWIGMDQEACPQCDGTGECQHKGKWAYASSDNENWLPRCLDCGKEVERRSGEERRECARRERDIGRRTLDKSDSHIDRRILKDRRNAEIAASSAQASPSAQSGA